MPTIEALAELDSLHVVLGALVVGAAASLHCFLMCGPLACASGGAQELRSKAIAAYHLARFFSYALAGALLGALGETAAALFSLKLAPIAPWLLVAALLMSALELGRRVPPIPALAKIVRMGALQAQRLHPLSRAAAIGALTPLLPCGLMYALFAASAASGSPLTGALMMGAFALGAAPALLLAQAQVRGLRARGGRIELALRRGVPALAALVLTYRALFIHASHGCH